MKSGIYLLLTVFITLNLSCGPEKEYQSNMKGEAKKWIAPERGGEFRGVTRGKTTFEELKTLEGKLTQNNDSQYMYQDPIFTVWYEVKDGIVQDISSQYVHDEEDQIKTAEEAIVNHYQNQLSGAKYVPPVQSEDAQTEHLWVKNPNLLTLNVGEWEIFLHIGESYLKDQTAIDQELQGRQDQAHYLDTFVFRVPDISSVFYPEVLNLSKSGHITKAAYDLRYIDDIRLLSNKVKACEASIDPGVPFAKAVKPGVYPVVQVLHKEWNMTSAAMILFKKEPISKWEPAVFENDKVQENGTFYGFGVDGGTGSFGDNLAFEAYWKQLETSSPDFDSDFEKLQKNGFIKTPITTSEGPSELFTFSCDDGVYLSYWGLNAKGEVCALVTDYYIDGLLDDF
ncbi:MAG: DUF4241 domain-containing protein [Flavobacteriales bacterium]|nr:DUF4241 domain-containing protein [Flavobacteriales bacterium]